jgi:hypothetical protein
VADRVEPALGVKSLAQVAVGEDDSLAVVQRARDHPAPRRLDDCGAATAEDLLVGQRHREVLRERRARHELRHGDDERAGLDRDVAHRRQPAVGVVGRRREPDLRA